MSLEKRIKRHVIGREHDLFAVTLPRYEGLCADDLKALSDTVSIRKVLKGGVVFNGKLTDVYLGNLYARTTGRILMRLVRFKATNFNQFASHMGKFPWDLYLAPGALPEVKVTARRSRLYHTGAVAGHIEQSIGSFWADHNVALSRATDQTFFVRLQDDEVTVSLDSSGEPLYRRGLKTHRARAPLRETMAAAILQTAGYRPGIPLVDPMCGSGSFSLEAALMAKNIPPGYFRRFSFMQWPAFRPRQWAYLMKIAGQGINRLDTPLIWASDVDQKACTELNKCVNSNQLEDAVTVSRRDFFDLRPEHIPRTGLIVLNPPYGLRLHSERDVRKRYMEIVAKLKKDFKGWHAAVLVPDSGMAKKLDMGLKQLMMHHGGLELTLLVGKI